MRLHALAGSLCLELSQVKVLTGGHLHTCRAYDRLVLRDRLRKRKVFLYPSVSSVDKTVISYIESNGGKNDVLAQPMWVGQQDSGGWSFVSCELTSFGLLSVSFSYSFVLFQVMRHTNGSR